MAKKTQVAAATSEGPAKRRVRPGIVHTSIYIPRAVHQKLREIAFVEDCKIHDLIMEGIDAALRKHGHPGVDSLRDADPME